MATGDRALMAAEQEVQSYRTRLANVRKKGEALAEKMASTTIAGASAFGFGYLEGRYPDRAQIANIPLSAVVGGAIVTAGAFGLFGKEERYIAPIGIGAVAAAAAIAGLKKGQDAAAEAA